MIGAALFQILVQNAEVNHLVDTRICPTVIPQAVPLPAIYYREEGVKLLSVRKPNGSFSGTFQIGVAAKTYDEVPEIIAAIRKALDDYDGFAASIGLSLGRGLSLDPTYSEKLEEHAQELSYSCSGQIKSQP